MKKIFFLFSLAVIANISTQAQCGSLRLDDPVVDPTGNAGFYVDLRYDNPPSDGFIDFDIKINFTGSVTVSVTPTDNSTNASSSGGYQADQSNNGTNQIRIRKSSFPIGALTFSSNPICRIYFDLDAGQSTTITFLPFNNTINNGNFTTCNNSNSNTNTKTFTAPLFQITGGVDKLPAQGQTIDVPDVKLKISEVNGTGEVEVFTNNSGNYTAGLAPSTNYEARASKVGLKSCGLNTGDIQTVQNHVLGSIIFTENWQYIAADANESGGKITTFDIVKISQTIQGNGSGITSSWNFLPVATYQFLPAPVVSSNTPVPTYNEVASFTTNMNQFPPSFFGVKIGDLIPSCNAPDINGQLTPSDEIEGRSEKIFSIKDIIPIGGNQYEIPIYAENFDNASVFAMGITFDTDFFNILDLQSALPEFDEEDYTIEEDKLFLLWFTMEKEGISLSEDQAVFTVVVELKQIPERLNGLIRMDHSKIPSKFHSGDVAGTDISLSINPNLFENLLNGSTITSVVQVYPNPVDNRINLEFEAVKTGSGIVELVDRSGNVLFRNKYGLVEGLNTINISLNDNIHDGILLYRIITDTGILSGQVSKVSK